MLVKRFFNDLKKYFRYSVRLGKATLKSEVAGSYLNWLWWILNPLLCMLIYSLIFGTVFNAKEQYFPLFIFIGLTLWNFFNNMLLQSVKMVKNNKPVISRTYIPKFILIVSDMYVNAFKMAVSFVIVFVMLILYKVPFSFSYFYVLLQFIPLFLVTYGLSAIVMHAGVFVQDLSNIIAILLRFLFYFTGIFYDIQKRVPEPWNELVVKLNPIASVIVSSRKAFLNGEATNLGLLCVWTLVGIVLSIIGTHLIYKNENTYVKVI